MSGVPNNGRHPSAAAQVGAPPQVGPVPTVLTAQKVTVDGMLMIQMTISTRTGSNVFFFTEEQGRAIGNMFATVSGGVIRPAP